MSLASVNVAFLGSEANAALLAKRGMQTDMTFFGRKESGVIRTYVIPNGFPEKIQPLLQSINLAEHVIFYVDTLNRFAGEQILALDAAAKTSGILCHAPAVDHDTLVRAVKKTAVDKYRIIEPEQMRAEAAKLRSDIIDGPPAVVVDHSFLVKGAGTIVLGKVVSGVVSKYDVLRAAPSGHEVMVKSIQMHDDPVEVASSPARVGLALKGITPDEIGRGDVLYDVNFTPAVSDTIQVDFTKTPFYKGQYGTNQMCMISIGLQVISAKIIDTEPLVVSLDRPAVCDMGDRVVVLKPDSKSVRIMGSGTILG